ncbi:hypothetical protein HET69_34665 [Streptomyces sp. CJ_13]|uniref:hypothetical protein n=1 Tax=Streptomyces sp. CJ_13 TaxID=2724943 RepID=UPI001BDD6072|nr:hypothetical protein [Streptomyces sp. CJ_13]MBT1188992.1 hypothetical protein [Streptomyces sp. CJ_13]
MSDFYRMLDALEEIRPDLARVAGGRWPKLSADLDALREKVRSGSLPPALASVRLVALVQPYPAVLELVSAFPVVLQPDAVLQLRHGAADAAPRPRFVNLVFEPRGPSGPVPRDAPLEPDRDYFLRLDIGHLSKDSIVARAKNDHFPAEHLPETTDGHWLDIAVTSVDFATDSLSKASLFLPSHGPSWTCPCDPNQGHSCYPYQRHPYVFLALRTPKAAGSAHARLTIWARDHVVQSLLIAADIALAGQPGQTIASVDYSLTSDLTDLDELQPRGLSVVTNQRPDGTHTLTFKSGEELGFTLAEHVLVGEMRNVRQLLFGVHAARGEGAAVENQLDARNGKCRDAFVQDLKVLARKGWTMWTSLFAQQPDTLHEATSGPTTAIQVARVPSTTFVYPWSAVYDIPLDMDTDERLTPCPVVATWDGMEPLFPNYPSQCPHAATHALNTLCPFGFWGIRHIIEHPPSSTTPSRQVRVLADRRVVMVRSSQLGRQATARHCKALADTLPGFTMTMADTFQEASTALAVSDLQLVEFYCHGKGGPTNQWLEIGDGEKIFPGQIPAWHLSAWSPPAVPDGHWQHTRPLILLNGCHTTAMTPQSPVSFADVFTAVHAAGVVGTEISLMQPLAGEATELLLHHFYTGQRMGEALRRMRHDLLAKGNLLGLAYTAYCSADLQLIHTPT